MEGHEELVGLFSDLTLALSHSFKVNGLLVFDSIVFLSSQAESCVYVDEMIGALHIFNQHARQFARGLVVYFVEVCLSLAAKHMLLVDQVSDHCSN